MNGQDMTSIEAIPDSLKVNANVVYILDEGEYEIIADDKATFRVHETITILNTKGQWHATQTVGYDLLRKIKYFKGKVYNASGKLIKTLNKSDIVDQSAYDGFSIYSDNRIKYADLRQNSYPYIVDFEYEIEFKHTYSVPSWQVLGSQNTSVLKSKFSIKTPKAFKPRIKVENTNKVFSELEEEGIAYMNIEFNNIQAKEQESYGPKFSELSPIINCAPSKFNYDGYEGDMSTWREFGLWQLELNKGRDILSDEAILKIQELTENLNTREDKIRAVYEFVQNKTRYVSIQLGIGGLQPFPASDVDELGYGDCKALSNYTYSLLKTIDIESNYTIVYGGENPPKVDETFPDDNFNHIILCVPNDKDSVWLECTSQTNPFGYLGSFTGDRDVLVVNDSGGHIIHTPTYSKEDNTQVSRANVTIDEDGQTTATLNIQYSGLQSENNNLNFILTSTDQEQKTWINENMDIADFTIQNFSFETKKSRVPVTMQKTELSINNFVSAKGSRLFFAPNLMNQWNSSPPRYNDRKTDVITKFTGVDIDSITYNIPEKYYAEYLPEPISIESDFGNYNASVSFENEQLLYVRKLELNKGRFPKESYEEFRNFHRKISKADQMKVVFVDKT